MIWNSRCWWCILLLNVLATPNMAGNNAIRFPQCWHFHHWLDYHHTQNEWLWCVRVISTSNPISPMFVVSIDNSQLMFSNSSSWTCFMSSVLFIIEIQNGCRLYNWFGEIWLFQLRILDYNSIFVIVILSFCNSYSFIL